MKGNDICLYKFWTAKGSNFFHRRCTYPFFTDRFWQRFAGVWGQRSAANGASLLMACTLGIPGLGLLRDDDTSCLSTQHGWLRRSRNYGLEPILNIVKLTSNLLNHDFLQVYSTVKSRDGLVKSPSRAFAFFKGRRHDILLAWCEVSRSLGFPFLWQLFIRIRTSPERTILRSWRPWILKCDELSGAKWFVSQGWLRGFWQNIRNQPTG